MSNGGKPQEGMHNYRYVKENTEMARRKEKVSAGFYSESLSPVGRYACLVVCKPIPCYAAKELPGNIMTLHDNENNEISMKIIRTL